MLTQLPVCRTCRTGRSFSTLLLTAAVLAFILVNVPHLAAQPEQAPRMDECSGGTLYYLAFPDTVTNAQDSRFAAKYPEEFFLYIYSPVNQQVKIGRAHGASLSINVTGGDILEFDTKSVAVPLITGRNSPQTNVLKVEAESPVIIYAYMATRFGCAAFTPVPVEGWGTKYYAATWEGEYVRDVIPAGENNFDASTKVPAPAEILVIAAEDNTQVSINPTGSLAACSNCTRVTLKAGEAYLVQSFVDTSEGVEHQVDLAGSLITSSKPIGVITANARVGHVSPDTALALAGNSYKDLTAEWLAPVEQHGTEFVFLPMWDDFRQRPDAAPIRENEYVRVYATTSRRTDVRDAFGNTVPGGFRNGEYMSGALVDLQNAVYYHTTQPGQAFQSPGTIVKFNGTTGSANFIGASYKSWGTSMVEMVPREQWTSFAPFKAPSYPSSMKHYLNVVTDTGNQFNVYYRSGNSGHQLFPFNRGRVPGTDLIWGSIVVNPGLNYTLESDNGGRFSGYVYGQWGGYELYRPGRAKEEGKGGETSAAHPSEYEENIAMTYAYPLAPSRCVLTEPNQYRITVSQDGCNRLCVSVEPTNDTPAGLEFVRLVDDRSVTFNTRMEFIEPPQPKPGMLSARFCLVPVNPTQPARAVVEVRDRTRNGQIYRIPFVYDPETVEIGPGTELDFGKIPVGRNAGEREVTIVNPTNRPVAIRLLRVSALQGFRITRTSPAIDWTNRNNADTLAPGDTLRVWIDIKATQAKETYEDALVVELGCYEAYFSLRAQSGGEACLIVGDLDFGRVPAGERKILPLEICNVGDAEVSFQDSSMTGGGAYLTWLGSEFYVTNSEISKLKNAVLGPGECVTIVVSFSSEIDGISRTVARFWANTRECRDTSIWSAYVSGVSGVDERGDASGYAIGTIAPNPFSRVTEIPFTLGKGGVTRVEIYNTEGVLVTKLLEESLNAGEHRVEWDAGEYPAGRYFVRIASGEWNDSRSIQLVR